MSSGASGLRSKLSMWLQPPYWTTKMHDRSGVWPWTGAAARACSKRGQTQSERGNAAELEQSPTSRKRHGNPPWVRHEPVRERDGRPFPI